MINITSMTRKEYLISLTENDKGFLLSNVERIVINTPKAFILYFELNGEGVELPQVDYERLKKLNIHMKLNFKNYQEELNNKGVKKEITPLNIELVKEESLVVQESKIESTPTTEDVVECDNTSDDFSQEGLKTTLFKKPIRSGQTEIFKNGAVLTENINETGKVVSYGNLVLLKKNFGSINIEQGCLLLDPNKNFGAILVDGVDISELLLKNDDIRAANKVLIEKTDSEIKYEIYQ